MKPPCFKTARRGIYLLGACTAIALASFAQGDVSLPAMFSDHMVLLKSDMTPIWGSAKANQAIQIAMAGLHWETKADGVGKWRADLNLSAIGQGPFDMTVEGDGRVEIKDVLVGEVWLCSGQSNMAQKMQYLKTEESLADIANSADSSLREFRLKTALPPEPADQCEGKWILADAKSTAGFSAVGYYFARELRKTLGVPVGLLTNAVAGTPVEGWTSLEGLKKDPELGDVATRQKVELHDFPTAKAAFIKDYPGWGEKYGREDRPSTNPAEYIAATVSPAGWTKVTIPGAIADPLDGKAGAVWLRKTARLTDATAGRELEMLVGIPHEFETVFWNGSQIGAKTLKDYPGAEARESYKVPAELARAGDNVIAIRLFNPLESPSIGGFPRWMRLDTIALEGEWMAKPEFTLPPLSEEARAAYPKAPRALMSMQRISTLLFNGMVNPLLPYALRGVLWYQGEDNTDRAAQYRTAFPLLINDWRGRWGKADLPFYFCQLAGFKGKKAQPGESDFAELRDAQTRALSLPKTAEALLIDQGEEGQIHFAHKEIAGGRLAAIALAGAYQKDVPFKGPAYRSSKVEGGDIRLTFEIGAEKLVARPLTKTTLITSIPLKTEPLVPNSPGSELEGFAICGDDHKWVWADARIDGDSVVVNSRAIPKPFAVRYAWADNPTCNLYNGAGFPAGPFQTFDFPAVTAANKYH